MKQERKTAIIVGVLILIAYAVIASSLTESKIIVMLSEVVSGIAVVGIAVLMFPLFKFQSKKLTFSYLSLKLVEGALMIIAGISFLSFSLPFLQMRNPIYTVHTHIFIVSALMFYILLYKSKIVPKWISIWGIIAIPLLLTANLLEFFNGRIPTIMSVIGYSPIVLNEAVLAFWLMIRGFNSQRFNSTSSAK